MDVRVDNHGSVVVMNALTVAAQEWFEAHLPEDRQHWGRNGTVVEPRYVQDIVDGLEADGLEVVS
jgi:hypothetical protein